MRVRARQRPSAHRLTAVLGWHDCCWVKATRRIPPMNLMSRVAVLAISAVPMCAQAQQSGVVKLKADAQNIVKIISGDKVKTQTYCEIGELDDEINEEQGSSKAEELSQKVDKLVEKLGPEYIALVSAPLRTLIPIPKTVRRSVRYSVGS